MYVTGDSHSYINCIVNRHLPRESPRYLSHPALCRVLKCDWSSRSRTWIPPLIPRDRKTVRTAPCRCQRARECFRVWREVLRPNDHRSAHVERPQRCLRDRTGHLSSVCTSLPRDWFLFHNDLRSSRKLIPIQVSMTPSQCKHSFPSVRGLTRIDWDDSILALASPEIEIIAFSVTFGVYPT